MLETAGLNYVTPEGKRALHDVALTPYAGEILGIAGVEGNGQTELVEVLAGLLPPAAGTIRMAGHDVTALGPRGRREAGIAHIPEDRLALGLAADASMMENLIVDRYYRAPFSRFGFLRRRAEEANARTAIADYDVRTPSAQVPARALSAAATCKSSSWRASFPPTRSCCSPPNRRAAWTSARLNSCIGS